MTITFTSGDRKKFLKRFNLAEQKDRPEEVVTVIHIDGVSVEQRYE